MHDILDIVVKKPLPITLATIIQTEGSSYQKAGAMMAFDKNGEQIGMLSGGCIEEELSHYVNDLSPNKWATKEIDMTEDSWFSEAGCYGVLYVLLETVDETVQEFLRRVVMYIDAGLSVKIVKHLGKSETLCICENGHHFGNWQGEVEKVKHVREGLHGSMYVQTILPRPRLIIFGAGEDAKPLVLLAKQNGFSITISDWRESLCTPRRFPEADHFFIGFPSEIFHQLAIQKKDFVVMMTHHLERDEELLRLLSKEPCRYVGILGSKERKTRLFAQIKEPEWVFSPVGLSIGARGPNEIAVSIMGEIIQQLRKA
ncbi:XdhC family protein [Bacillus spongiae]|uniref:XdhC family protein n=1 Tax=Bacillus spongiae TaxID=2683610 RepID=A0ABU8HJB9_9BACI